MPQKYGIVFVRFLLEKKLRRLTMIITEEMVRRAIELIRPTAETMLNEEDLIWGPRYVNGSARVRGLRAIEFRYGTAPKEWNPKWGEKMDFARLASQKRRQSEQGKANTSDIMGVKPWILHEGDYLYAGGAWRDGIAVGISGADGLVDEAIAMMVIDAIVMLALMETEKRLKAGQAQI